MIYLVWSLPLIVIAVLMATGRASSIGAGLCGALVAIVVALAVAPISMTPLDVLTASVKGLWLSWLVAAVIFAGLFFREIVSKEGDDLLKPEPASTSATRRRVFTACFLVGPFAEAATGFGVGQVTTVAMLHRIGLAPIHVVLLALFSQTLVSWGAMANGTVVGAEFAGMTPRELGTHSAILSAPLLLGWLVIFWRMADIGRPWWRRKEFPDRTDLGHLRSRFADTGQSIVRARDSCNGGAGPLDRVAVLDRRKAGSGAMDIDASCRAALRRADRRPRDKSRGACADGLASRRGRSAALRRGAHMVSTASSRILAACGRPDHGARDGSCAGRPFRCAEDVVPRQEGGDHHLDLSDHRADPR